MPKQTKQYRSKRIQNKTAKKYRNDKKSKPINNELRSSIVRSFLQLLNLVKLYHWKTYVYSQHHATDELYANLNEHIDKFIEVLLGKSESRIKMMEKKIQLFDSKNKTEFKQHIYDYREFLIDMNNYFDKNRDSDLLNIRDEILGDINQFLYLMTFH
jgi:DNA-binding ferritin-like protein